MRAAKAPSFATEAELSKNNGTRLQGYVRHVSGLQIDYAALLSEELPYHLNFLLRTLQPGSCASLAADPPPQPSCRRLAVGSSNRHRRSHALCEESGFTSSGLTVEVATASTPPRASRLLFVPDHLITCLPCELPTSLYALHVSLCSTAGRRQKTNPGLLADTGAVVLSAAVVLLWVTSILWCLQVRRCDFSTTPQAATRCPWRRTREE